MSEVIVDNLYGSRVWDEIIDIIFHIECHRSFQNSVEKMSTVGSAMRSSQEVDGVKPRSQIFAVRVVRGKYASLEECSASLLYAFRRRIHMKACYLLND